MGFIACFITTMCFYLLDYHVGYTSDDVCLILTDEVFNFGSSYVAYFCLEKMLLNWSVYQYNTMQMHYVVSVPLRVILPN